METRHASVAVSRYLGRIACARSKRRSCGSSARERRQSGFRVRRAGRVRRRWGVRCSSISRGATATRRRDEWARRLDAGEVQLDGVVAAPSDRLRAGQRLDLASPALAGAGGAARLRGAARATPTCSWSRSRAGCRRCPPAGSSRTRCSGRCGGATPMPFPAHRLGRGTSGLVVFARSAVGAPRSAAGVGGGCRGPHLSRAGARPAERDAVHHRRCRSGWCRMPRSARCTPRTAPTANRRGRASARSRAGDDASLVEVQIETGRPDQIRIHLAAAGHPLVGDPFYGAGGLPLPDGRALPGDGGYLLHATRLEFPHPRTGARTIVECPPPAGAALVSRAPHLHDRAARGSARRAPTLSRARTRRLRRRLQLRGQARSLPAARRRRRAHHAPAARHGGRDRVRAQSDDPREPRLRSAAAHRRPLPARARLAGAAAHRAALQRAWSRPARACARWCWRSGRSGRSWEGQGRARASRASSIATR